MPRFQQSTSTGQAPVIKSTTLIVLAAFDRDDEGELRPAFEAQQMPSEHAAISRAKLMSRPYAGVIAWKRPARPDMRTTLLLGWHPITGRLLRKLPG